jgi:hypothetical protein
MHKTVLLDFVHHLNYTTVKLEHSGSWILLQSSGTKERFYTLRLQNDHQREICHIGTTKLLRTATILIKRQGRRWSHKLHLVMNHVKVHQFILSRTQDNT